VSGASQNTSSPDTLATHIPRADNIVMKPALSRRGFLGSTLLTVAGAARAQNLLPTASPTDGIVYVCPMDPDVRSNNPGVCPRCGMKLASGIPEQAEFHMDLVVTPRPIKPGLPSRLSFYVHDPWKDRQVTNFQLVHEKLFHMFIVSQDLQVFVHDHPIFQPDGSFTYDYKFPKPGMYRILGDFYPDGATPQLIAKTLFVTGSTGIAKTPVLPRDYSPKDAENMNVSLHTDPPQAIAGLKTQMYFDLKPADGLEKYIGAWGHMLAASDDLIDLIHTHPFIADGGPQVEFNVTFPRAQTYRVWVQFQRKGVVNTAHFDVPVEELK
jgi:hypothetical protein